MRTKFAIAALLYSLASAVDLFEDNMLDDDDQFDDDELSDVETTNLAQTSAEAMNPLVYNGYHYTFHGRR